MLFLLLSGAIFGACSSDKDRVPVFVKNVVMPPDSWVFAPGDGVTVSAEGFEADDEIMLEIHWQESAEGFAPEGYAKGVRGIVTVRSATSVTFLAPGHYPASTVRVLLLRRGRMMPLGKIRVANGTPKAEALYGISKSDTDETLIERIDLSTGGGDTGCDARHRPGNCLRRGASRFGLDLRRLLRFDGRFRPHDELL